MILHAFALTLNQIDDPRFRRVLYKGVGLTIALLIGACAAFLGLLQWLTGDTQTVPFLGEVTWVGDLLTFASLGIFLLLSIFLMIPVASAITSLFLDEVAEAVEDRHYPNIPRPPRVGFWAGLRDSINFLGLLIGLNLVAFLFYALFPFAAPLIFIALNGALLGREYFQISAMRHLGRDGARALRQRHRGLIWLAGCLMAIPLVIPILNLVIPILGAATFTHLFHRVQASTSG
ncbi:MAG: EI24 domain-containing protein [Shimia sp.]